ADTAFEEKHIRPKSSVHPISRAQSAADLRRNSLLYPGIENEI
ncbi:unnamed protein product, partial [Rotaria sp. Silwood1]